MAKDQGKNEGRTEGRTEGRIEGKISEILLAQRILRQRLHTKEELKTKSLDELKRIFDDFEARLTF